MNEYLLRIETEVISFFSNNPHSYLFTVFDNRLWDVRF